jgi:pimeloyl-ACP methyl ester carboxylesterase
MASILAVGCGAHDHHRPRADTAPRAIPVIIGSGGLVKIGAGRTLFLNCVGRGTPTVVLEAGLGGDSFNWQGVQPQLGRVTRTCAYDRAGLGNSVSLPGVHDARAEIDDLAHLLDGARLDPPYVLVGHSYGGLLARLFAAAHPQEVAGLVLVDAMTRDQTRRQLAIWPRSQAQRLRREVATRVRDGVDLAAGEALAGRIRSLGDTRLAVITAGRHDAEWGTVPRKLARALDRQWATMQDELAALSSDHLHVVALRSDHFVQGIDGQPRVVVATVRALVGSARAGARLPPCRRLFSGADVACRS